METPKRDKKSFFIHFSRTKKIVAHIVKYWAIIWYTFSSCLLTMVNTIFVTEGLMGNLNSTFYAEFECAIRFSPSPQFLRKPILKKAQILNFEDLLRFNYTNF